MVNVADAEGLAFECLPGCGFCCTVSPLVGAHEAAPLQGRAVRGADGALRIPIQGQACSALGRDRRCGVYEARPTVCRLYPYQVHAGRRVQATVSLACPGITEARGGEAPVGARSAAQMALARPGASEMAARAKGTFAEFDRRMDEWGQRAAPDQLRAAFLPHVDALARPESLPPFFAGIAGGDLALGARPARAVAALFDAEPEASLVELLDEGARDAFAENASVLWVEAWNDFAWRAPKLADVDADALPVAWAPDAVEVLADYLRRLLHRDHTEGAAAWLVDASGYQATPAAAYGRVLGEAALHVVLRAGMIAKPDAVEVDAVTAERGVRAYETSYHSLPTLGSIL